MSIVRVMTRVIAAGVCSGIDCAGSRYRFGRCAARGAALRTEQCIRCHNVKGRGANLRRTWGGASTATSRPPRWRA